MGGFYSVPQTQVNEVNSDTEDESFIPASVDKDTIDLGSCVVDAIGRSTTSIQKFSASQNITFDNIPHIESLLDLYEKVSIVFLLHDNPEIALNYLQELVKGVSLNIIYEWAKSVDKWQDKLIEALSIIQNYFILAEFGYNKIDIEERFLPMNENTSLNIVLYKKKLYRIFDNLTTTETQTFLNHIKDDFEKRNLVFEDYPVKYIEMHLLLWLKLDYISSINLHNLAKPFKLMQMFDIAENLQFPPSIDPSFVNNNPYYQRLSSTTSVSSIQQDNVHKNHDNKICYKICNDSPGVCLIINQKYFYTEPEQKYSHLLPAESEKLENRLGTDIDAKSLEQIFLRFGYNVIIKTSLDHTNILLAIKDTLRAIHQESSLIICILSHGVEGKIYGANSIPVNVSEITKIMCNTNVEHLKGKPKVLILQSCQGSECQDILEDDEDTESDIQMDGPTTAVPRTADLLIFWATVPGYGAIRDKKKGSWFIQSLCKTILENHNKMHFSEMCIMVKNSVTSKIWEIKKKKKAMVPYENSTLTKFFFLPPMK